MSSFVDHLECARCGRQHDATRLQQRCSCGGTLLVRYHLDDGPDLRTVRARPPGMWRYRELLPLDGDPVSLGEPQTPLLSCPRLSERWSTEIYLKDESPLPGGTFKGRGAAVGLSRALELGVNSAVMPSAGNAGGAWALYAARAGISLTVAMAESAPATQKAEVQTAGARLELVPGTLADAGARAHQIASETGMFLAATFSEPYRVEGKKSAWLEVFDVLGRHSALMSFPRTIVMPVGGGVAAVAAAKAVEEVTAAAWSSDDPPKIVGVQAEICAPIARAFAEGQSDVAPWEGDCHTVAAGLRVPAPVEGALVLEKIRSAGGSVVTVTEDEIVSAVRDLASTEGVFACPEGAATVAAARRLVEEGNLEGPVVLYNTGTGAKYAEALAEAGL